MIPLPLVDGDDLHLLVAYSISSDEDMIDAVVNAFLAVNIDVFEKPTQLADWIDPEFFDVLQWSADRPHYLITEIWDHQVIIAGEQIRIYTQSRTSTTKRGEQNPIY